MNTFYKEQYGSHKVDYSVMFSIRTAPRVFGPLSLVQSAHASLAVGFDSSSGNYWPSSEDGLWVPGTALPIQHKQEVYAPWHNL